MAAINVELMTWVEERSESEREALLNYLARRSVTAPDRRAIPIEDDESKIVGFVLPGTSSADWFGLTDPKIIREVQHRRRNPDSKLILEELITQVESKAGSVTSAASGE